MTASWDAEEFGTGADLAQLLYVSRSLIAADSVLQLSDILNEARAGNSSNGITGVLTAVDGQFVQIIEGSPAHLNALMARLERDRRHTNIQVVEIRSIVRRTFGDWDMVSPRLVGAKLAELREVLAGSDLGLDAVTPILVAAIATQEALLGASPTASRSVSPRQAHGLVCRPD